MWTRVSSARLPEPQTTPSRQAPRRRSLECPQICGQIPRFLIRNTGCWHLRSWFEVMRVENPLAQRVEVIREGAGRQGQPAGNVCEIRPDTCTGARALDGVTHRTRTLFEQRLTSARV